MNRKVTTDGLANLVAITFWPSLITFPPHVGIGSGSQVSLWSSSWRRVISCQWVVVCICAPWNRWKSLESGPSDCQLDWLNVHSSRHLEPWGLLPPSLLKYIEVYCFGDTISLNSFKNIKAFKKCNKKCMFKSSMHQSLTCWKPTWTKFWHKLYCFHLTGDHLR